MKLSELASLTSARVEGDSSDIEITGAAGLEVATPGQVTFLANPRYTPKVNSTEASAIYLSEDARIDRDLPVLRAANPYLAYTRALRLFHPEPEHTPFVHESAVIDPSAKIAANVWIGACSVIGPFSELAEGVRIHPNVTIYDHVAVGQDCVIHSGSVIRERSQLGERVVIHNNVVVGCDGFGYAKDEERKWLKIPQTGRVIIEDDVEIGAGTTIDRASVGESRIRRGTKIDNLVQIGHSCTVGEDTLLCAQVGLAGSSHIGSRVILAGQAGVAGHLTIGDDVVLTAKSATSHDVPAGKVISGIPAFDNRDWLRSTAAFRRLGEMQRKIRELEKRLAAIEGSPVIERPAVGRPRGNNEDHAKARHGLASETALSNRMIRISTNQFDRFRRILEAFPEKPTLPGKDEWRNRSDDDIWIRIVSQVVVVGRASPADKLCEPDIRRRIAWNQISQMEEEVAAQAIWGVLREIGARYTGRDWRSCRKTNAIMENLAYLKKYPEGPKGFLAAVAMLNGSSYDKIRLVATNLSYIKNKGARDFLMSGFGLVQDHIALDSRVLKVLNHIDVEVPQRVTLDPEIYKQVERDLMQQVCDPLGITGAELDQLLFKHYKEIIQMF